MPFTETPLTFLPFESEQARETPMRLHVVHNIAVDRDGNVYTTEVNTGQRIQKFRRLDAQN